jgi:hypothetical protein
MKSFMKISITSGASLFAILFVYCLSYAQPEVVWQRDLDIHGGGAIIELENGDFLARARQSWPPVGFGLLRFNSNGIIVDEYILPHEESGGAYLELLPSGEVLTLLEVDSYSFSSFGIIAPDSELLWESEPFSGAGLVHQNDINGFSAGSRYRTPSDSSYAVITQYDYTGSILWSIQYIDRFYVLHDLSVDVMGNLYAPIYTLDVGSEELIVKKIDPYGNQIAEFLYEAQWDFIATYRSTIMPDGNLLLFGRFPIDLTEWYQAIIISPTGDLLETFDNYQGNSTRPELYIMSDGGYMSVKGIYENNNVHVLRLDCFDASWNLLWTYNYELNGIDYNQFGNVTPLITKTGEVVLFGNYYYGDWPQYHIGYFITKISSVPTDLELTIEPYGNVNDVPAPGRFNLHGVLTNNTNAEINTDIWIITRGPDGYPSEPLRVWEDITVPVNGVYEADLRQVVPVDAAAGEYNYIVRAGDYVEGNPQHTIQDYFPLTVISNVAVDLDPPRVRGIVAAPFEGPVLVQDSDGR